MFEFVNYFGGVFAPTNFLALCLGTAGGLIMGALPGLSPTMAVALLIPFPFHLPPTTGLILLGRYTQRQSLAVQLVQFR